MTKLQATQTRVIILLGPPGAGKGSQAGLLQSRSQIAHISTGDLLRDHIGRETELGKQAKTYMDQGDLVPDKLIFDMLFTRTGQVDCSSGYMLDGFPRNLAQAQQLQKRLQDHRVIAINLSVSDEAVIERITKRQICTQCQAPYHLNYCPPKELGICDRCGGQLYQRSDDSHAVVQRRLKVYREQTAPLIDYYEQRGTLSTVDSSRPREEVLKDILEILGR